MHRLFVYALSPFYKMVQDKSWDDYLKDFEERKARVFAMGGEKQVVRQHEEGS